MIGPLVPICNFFVKFCQGKWHLVRSFYYYQIRTASWLGNCALIRSQIKQKTRKIFTHLAQKSQTRTHCSIWIVWLWRRRRRRTYWKTNIDSQVTYEFVYISIVYIFSINNLFTCTKNSEIVDNDEFEDIIVKTLDDQIHEHTDKRTTNSKKSELSLENFTKNNNSKNPEKMAQNSKKEVPHEMKTQRSLSFESGGGGGHDGSVATNRRSWGWWRRRWSPWSQRGGEEGLAGLLTRPGGLSVPWLWSSRRPVSVSLSSSVRWRPWAVSLGLSSVLPPLSVPGSVPPHPPSSSVIVFPSIPLSRPRPVVSVWSVASPLPLSVPHWVSHSNYIL